MKIHITLLGREPLPIYYPIKMFEQEKIHLIGTLQNGTIAQNIINYLEDLPCEFHEVNPYKPQEIIDLCESIHAKYPNDEFLYNLTGGTKPMSFAAYRVAMEHKAKAIYTTQTNEVVDMQSFESTPLEGDLSNKDIFALQGQRLKDYELLLTHQIEKVNAAKAIKLFIEKEGGKYYKSLKDICKREGMIPNHFCEEEIEFNKQEDRNISVKKTDGTLLLDINHPESISLLFKGRWWETLVADALLTWSEKLAKPLEIWQNIKFIPKNEKLASKGKDKNEIDILLNIGTKLLFVECKSGKIGQENIYKIDVIRDSYGGEMSKAVLASYYPIANDLLEKAEESHIKVFAPRNQESPIHHLDQVQNFFDEILKTLNV